jgi:NitT/TauT family transport system substrate-binding protein
VNTSVSVSRRRALLGGIVLAAGPLLAACAGTPPTATPAPAKPGPEGAPPPKPTSAAVATTAPTAAAAAAAMTAPGATGAAVATKPAGAATGAASPAAAATGAATAAAAAAATKPATMVKATVQMNWFPEPEHGGFYFAEMEGLYKALNVDVEVKAGGPGVDVTKLVATGQTKFAINAADSIALARNEGVPVVAFMSAFQRNPQIIMVHEESGINDFKDMATKGTKVAISSAAAYAGYLIKTYGWKEDQILRYNGQLAEWLLDKQRATQGYITTEPFYAKKEGAKPKSLLIADVAGYNPYASMLFTTEEVIKKEPELVHAVSAASIDGWRKYMASPEKTHAYLKTKAKDLADDGMVYNWETQKTLVPVGDAKEMGIGVMTAARWEELYKQLTSVNLLKADLNPKEAWTDQFFKPYLKV